MSTCVASYNYDKKTKELTIYFVKGGSYTYSGVPITVVRSLARVGSQGRFFNAVIRKGYT